MLSADCLVQNSTYRQGPKQCLWNSEYIMYKSTPQNNLQATVKCTSAGSRSKTAVQYIKYRVQVSPQTNFIGNRQLLAAHTVVHQTSVDCSAYRWQLKQFKADSADERGQQQHILHIITNNVPSVYYNLQILIAAYSPPEINLKELLMYLIRKSLVKTGQQSLYYTVIK